MQARLIPETQVGRDWAGLMLEAPTPPAHRHSMVRHNL